MLKNFKKIRSFASLSFSVLFLTIFLLNVISMINQNFTKNDIPSFFGYSAFLVKSETIRDKYGNLDLVIVKKADDEILKSTKSGDIMVFRYNSNFAVAKFDSTFTSNGIKYCNFTTDNKKCNYLNVENHDVVGKSAFILNNFGSFILLISKYMLVINLIAVISEILIIGLILKNTIFRKKEIS